MNDNELKTIHVRRLKGRIDFAIITIREDEFEAVLKRFAVRSPTVGGRQTYQFSRTRRRDGCTVNVAVVRAFDQGQSVATLVARDTIDDLQPRWLILTGIAGGIPDSEFSLGDVLLATSVHDFSISAAIQNEQPQFRSTGTSVHPEVAKLLAALPGLRGILGNWNCFDALGFGKPVLSVSDDLARDCYYGTESTREAVRGSLQRHFPDSGKVRLPLFKTAPLATSNVLVKDADLLSQWRKVARHITHIEMEAGGAYLAARHAKPEVPLLSIRGISDIVGFKRDPEWTQFACEVAASLTHAIVTIVPLETIYDGPLPIRHSIPRVLSRLNVLGKPLAAGWQLLSTCIQPIALYLTNRSLRTPTIGTIVAAFRESSKPLLSRIVAPDDRISRSELEALDSFVSAGEHRVVCLIGPPGSGKTALLALFTKNAIDRGAATLAIKADILPTDVPFETWGKREIGLDITALDAVKVVSTLSNVLVVVDQLDALASTVDLTSNRLNSILDFIQQCSLLPNVTVVCSCRDFEFGHDVRFQSLKAEAIPLELPAWDKVLVQLTRHGVAGVAEWPEAFRELLRTPQHLEIYLNRFESTKNTDSFRTYHLMLDDLWTRTITVPAEQQFIYDLTEYLVDHEMLWAPLARYENRQTIVDGLQAKHILQAENQRIGFRHQTLLEHAKARLFTKSDRSLTAFVLERQDAILVRPTLWAVLRYLREVDKAKYRSELEALFHSDLRLHLRYLLIDFLGQLSGPEDFEIALLADRVAVVEDRIRVLLAIRGKKQWFEALRNSHFPIIMQGAVDDQWPMIGVINDAWDFDRDACLELVEKYWLPDLSKDQLTWRAMSEIGKWDHRAVEIVSALIRRQSARTERLYWAESLVSAISADQPTLAPRIFVETVSRGTPNG